MIQDCKKKKIDLILTKSISRFARNTLDSIQYVRMLKAIGIAVIFEKENINTSTMNSEMILTVLSAFAQAESESISQNVARGKRMGFRQGKFPFPYGQILGYRKGLDGKPEVIPEEAEVIRMIFNSYLQGASLLTIKKKLEAGGVLTARGNKKWSSESVQRILQNEKYCGDVLLQKTFIEDVLTGVSKKNTGQLPQYYIENNHEGIVTKQMFREVQAEIARRNSKSAANQRKRHQGRYNSKYFLSVVQFLRFKTSLLFFFLGADAAVGRHSHFSHGVVFPTAYLSSGWNFDDSCVAHGALPYYNVCPFRSLMSICVSRCKMILLTMEL